MKHDLAFPVGRGGAALVCEAGFVKRSCPRSRDVMEASVRLVQQSSRARLAAELRCGVSAKAGFDRTEQRVLAARAERVVEDQELPPKSRRQGEGDTRSLGLCFRRMAFSRSS